MASGSCSIALFRQSLTEIDPDWWQYHLPLKSTKLVRKTKLSYSSSNSSVTPGCLKVPELNRCFVLLSRPKQFNPTARKLNTNHCSILVSYTVLPPSVPQRTRSATRMTSMMGVPTKLQIMCTSCFTTFPWDV